MVLEVVVGQVTALRDPAMVQFHFQAETPPYEWQTWRYWIRTMQWDRITRSAKWTAPKRQPLASR